MPTKTLALLIDGDNAPFQYLKQIIQFCKVFGTLNTKNAYGDWEQLPLSVHREMLKAHDVTEMQQDRIVPNATDMAMAMDVRSMLDKREADIYFIVSRDRDFTVVCDQILKTGAKVIGIGSEKNASVQLQTACTLFIDVDKIVKNQSKASLESATLPKPKTILKILVQAYKKTEETYGRVHLSQLQEQFSQLEEQSKLQIPKKTILKRINEFQDKFEVTDQYVLMK